MSDTKQHLIKMCQAYADDLGGVTPLVDDDGNRIETAAWLESNAYDINWVSNRDKTYKGAILLVAGGGPNIYVDTNESVIKGFWGGDVVEISYTDRIGLDEECESLFDCF